MTHKSIETIKRGDYVQTWFETFTGSDPRSELMFGIVIDSGPKSFRVRWESGATCRISRAEPRGVEPMRTPEMFEPLHEGGVLYWLEALHG